MCFFHHTQDITLFEGKNHRTLHLPHTDRSRQLAAHQAAPLDRVEDSTLTMTTVIGHWNR